MIGNVAIAKVQLESIELAQVGTTSHSGDYSKTLLQEAVAELERRVSEARDKGRRLYEGALPPAPDLSKDTREHLRSLGYIE